MNTDLFNDKIVLSRDNIFEVEGLPHGTYDAQAVQYDKLISNGLYNRLMWGNSPKNYADFCRQGINSNKGGAITDIGCGTLGFTYKVYADNTNKELYLCDLSFEMLHLGKQRIDKLQKDTSQITFLRSDAMNMPFKENALETVLSFGILHIFEKPLQLVKEMARIVKPEGQVFITSLCTERKWSARYLRLLQKKGHVAEPLSAAAIRNLVEQGGISITAFKVMAYISGIKS